MDSDSKIDTSRAELQEKEVSNNSQDIITSQVSFDPEVEKKLVRKIDKNLLYLMIISYMLQYLDKTSLGYSAILGIIKDTGLVGQQYSWVSSAFYFGYLVASYPASLCFVKLPLGKFLAGSIVIWAVILACHGAVTNFGSLLAIRVLLGVFESVISPGFSLLTGMWYTPSEHAWRHGIWFAGNSMANLFGGVLSYAIGHISDGVAPWRWIFIIFGIITFSWAIVMLILLPDNPLKARFLTPIERRTATLRVQRKQRSNKSGEWKLSQFVEALKDPKTWLLFIYTVVTSFPNGGLTNFSSLIVSGFGYSTFQTLLLGMPTAAFQLFYVLTATFSAGNIQNSRCVIIAILQTICIAGCVMIKFIPIDQKLSRLAGLWLFGAYAAGFPLSLSLIASDVAGFTKKTTVTAILFMGYCAGNIAGPQIFFASEAPGYKSAFTGNLICFCIAIVVILTLRQYMNWENKRRDREQGVHIDPEVVRAGREDTEAEMIADETDWENKTFRYIL